MNDLYSPTSFGPSMGAPAPAPARAAAPQSSFKNDNEGAYIPNIFAQYA